MKIMAFVEGASEAGSTEARHGAVGVLIQRLLGPDVVIEFALVKNVQHARGKGGTLFKKAIAATIVAAEKGSDAAVFLIDLDGPESSDRIAQLDAAQDHRLARLPHAMGVAIMEFEAWLLADEVAIRAGVKAHDDTDLDVPTQPDPEDSIKDAKAALEAIVGKRAKRELYPHIVEHLDLDRVAARCRRGFGVFRQRVLSLRPRTNG